MHVAPFSKNRAHWYPNELHQRNWHCWLNFSAVKVWRCSSTSTSWHTFLRRVANRSCTSSCLLWTNPPFIHDTARSTTNLLPQGHVDGRCFFVCFCFENEEKISGYLIRIRLGRISKHYMLWGAAFSRISHQWLHEFRSLYFFNPGLSYMTLQDQESLAASTCRWEVLRCPAVPKAERIVEFPFVQVEVFRFQWQCC